MTIHLRVQKSGTSSSGVVDNQIIEYRQPLSGLSNGTLNCYSYQYSPSCDPYED